MKFLWWYTAVICYLGIIVSLYDVLVGHVQADASFFGILLTIPIMFYLHKVHNYGVKP